MKVNPIVNVCVKKPRQGFPGGTAKIFKKKIPLEGFISFKDIEKKDIINLINGKEIEMGGHFFTIAYQITTFEEIEVNG